MLVLIVLTGGYWHWSGFLCPVTQQGKLEEAESSQRPLKEQAGKQSQRINELNAALRSREKQMKQLSQENLELVSEECDGVQ